MALTLQGHTWFVRSGCTAQTRVRFALRLPQHFDIPRLQDRGVTTVRWVAARQSTSVQIRRSFGGRIVKVQSRDLRWPLRVEVVYGWQNGRSFRCIVGNVRDAVRRCGCGRRGIRSVARRHVLMRHQGALGGDVRSDHLIVVPTAERRFRTWTTREKRRTWVTSALIITAERFQWVNHGKKKICCKILLHKRIQSQIHVHRGSPVNVLCVCVCACVCVRVCVLCNYVFVSTCLIMNCHGKYRQNTAAVPENIIAKNLKKNHFE